MDPRGLNQFTMRVLLSLIVDLAAAQESFRAIEAQIAALAKEHGVPTIVSPNRISG
jgi:hypothetical protein